MKKADSSPSKCGAILMRSCFSTKSKRRIPMCSTSCCRSWMMAASPTARAATVDFKNTVIIMTSNLGSVFLQSEDFAPTTASNEASKQVMERAARRISGRSF